MKLFHSFKTSLIEWRDGISPPVFFLAAAFNVTLILFAGFWTETAGKVFQTILTFITQTFDWYYILATAGFVVFVLWLVVSPYGQIRFGKQDEKPQYSRLAWLAMLFAAGMGMGLVFWGVAEPLNHFHAPPSATPMTNEAAREAIYFSYFHWGLHPWAMYVIFGLGIALLHFRHGLPLAPRSLLYPVFGKHFEGWVGHGTDAFCTVGTLLGVATSLGLGAMQINATLSRLTDIGFVTSNQLWIIALITIVATISTVSGVSRGIKYLSIANVAIMSLVLGFVFVAGPTLYQMKTLVLGLSDYLLNLAQISVWVNWGSPSDWQTNWTLFYWGWWISWSPFVGIFIARISRGRTIREFVFFVLLIPTAVNIIWFSVFGGTVLYIERFGEGGLAEPIIKNVAMSLPILLEHLPWTALTQWSGLLLMVMFFITSSDSGSFVDDMVTSGGNPNPPVANRVFWGISEGAAAAVLLLAGGLKALQAASISAGLPQSMLLIVACVGLVKILRQESLN